MGHVSYVEKDHAAEPLKPVYADLEKKLGAMPNLFKAMGHSPDLLQGFLALNGALSKMKLDPRLRELAYMKASQVNDCGYCLHYHRQFGRKVGLSESQVADLGAAGPPDQFDELQWDVLRFAEQVSRQVRADDALVARLKQRLSDRELVELTATVALANFTNRMNNALGVELP